MNEDISKYEAIINFEHHVSTKHAKMDEKSRAAQFAPFAALTGFGAVINETARLTEGKIELNEEAEKELDIKLNILQEKILKNPEIIITYFKKDDKKSGGKYITMTGRVKKINTINKEIYFIDTSEIIKFNDIIEISGEIFEINYE